MGASRTCRPWPGIGLLFLLAWLSTEVSAQGSTVLPEAAPLTLGDFAVVHRATGQVIQYGAPGQDLSRVLGSPSRVRTRVDRADPKWDRLLEWYPDLFLQYWRGDAGVYWISVYSAEYTTPRGVGVGSTVDQVRHAYGPARSLPGEIYYSWVWEEAGHVLDVTFYTNEDRVTDFSISYAYQ